MQKALTLYKTRFQHVHTVHTKCSQLIEKKYSIIHSFLPQTKCKSKYEVAFRKATLTLVNYSQQLASNSENLFWA